MDLENHESLNKIEFAVETIKSREMVERVSLIHQNGINIKSSSPELSEDQLDEVAMASSTIFSSTNEIHDRSWDHIIMECQFGKIIILPLFFDQSSKICPFFLQIVTQSDSNLKDLLLNATNSIEIIIKELLPINEELQFSSSRIPIALDEPLNFEGENPGISAILSNYFGSTSSLDIESVIVSINGKSLNSIGSNGIRPDSIDKNHLVHLRSLLSNSDKLIQILKNKEVTSIRIDYSNKFHFMFPLKKRLSQFREDFLSIMTGSQSKLGYWHVIVPQITHRINNSFS